MENEIMNLLLKNKNKDVIIHLLGTMDDKTVLSVCQLNKSFREENLEAAFPRSSILG